MFDDILVRSGWKTGRACPIMSTNVELHAAPEGQRPLVPQAGEGDVAEPTLRLAQHDDPRAARDLAGDHLAQLQDVRLEVEVARAERPHQRPILAVVVDVHLLHFGRRNNLAGADEYLVIHL